MQSPVTSTRVAGGGSAKITLSVSFAIGTVFLVLLVAVRYGQPLSRFAAHESDGRLQVSASIGAFLVGIAVSDPMA